MPRRLNVSIHPDGSIVADASGTPGPECLGALDQLRAILNADVEESRPTPEFAMPVSPRVVDVQYNNYLEVEE